MVCHYGVMDALCGVQAPNAGLIETRMWIDDDGQSHVQPLGLLRRPPLPERALPGRRG